MNRKSEFGLNAKRKGINLQLKQYPLKASYVKSLIDRKAKIEGELTRMKLDGRELSEHQERYLGNIKGY